jgi:hypothetical protein
MCLLCSFVFNYAASTTQIRALAVVYLCRKSLKTIRSCILHLTKSLANFKKIKVGAKNLQLFFSEFNTLKPIGNYIYLPL